MRFYCKMNVETEDPKEPGAKLEAHQLSRVTSVSGFGYKNEQEEGSSQEAMERMFLLIFLKWYLED